MGDSNNKLTVKDFIEENAWIVPVLVGMLGGDVTVTSENIADFGEDMTLVVHDTSEGLRFVKMPIVDAAALACTPTVEH